MAAPFFLCSLSLGTAILHAYCIVFSAAEGKIAAVGDLLGWTNFDLSKLSPPNYSAWAASQTIFPGDVLVFNFVANFHNVNLLPSKSAFESCNMTEATMLDNGASGTYMWKAPNETGVYYFACNREVEGRGTHCDEGQRLSLIVLPSISPSPSPNSSSVALSPC